MPIATNSAPTLWPCVASQTNTRLLSGPPKAPITSDAQQAEPRDAVAAGEHADHQRRHAEDLADLGDLGQREPEVE